ncbi:MAG TPA: ABC transporter permease [Burkholderiales bacterium]|nr:ABC transporter permease [Burkholderiales bacterium]
MTASLIQLQTRASGERVVVLSGDWTLKALRPAAARVARALKSLAADSTLHWDLRAIEALDSAGALMIWRAWGGDRRGATTIKSEHAAILERVAEVPPVEARRWRLDLLAPLVLLGRRESQIFRHDIALVKLVGGLVLDAFYLVAHPREIPWKEISATIYKAGVMAMPVTALVGFLIGVVLSYLTADTLKAYGAGVYIVNLLGISIVRELGPLLVAILIAGRSGSAMTAQIGVMRVTEEIDALVTIGISPISRLIMPKVIGLAIVMPLVSLWAIGAALLGGAIAAKAQLGLSVVYFLGVLPKVVSPDNLWIAMVKALTFGMAIAMIASDFGLRTKPNTESVSSSITTAVVTSITIVILMDAVFAILFRDVGFE